MANPLMNGVSLPAFNCPSSTRMHILNLGTLQVDEGWLLQGAGTGSKSTPNPTNQHRDLILAAGLIDHPDLGLILFETGCAEDVDISWGAPFTDLFPRTVYTEEMELPNAIKAAGYDIKDVKAIVMGHLHLDHAGGLEHFIGEDLLEALASGSNPAKGSTAGTDVPIYVHEEEFKYACWAVGTGADSGVYLGDYMNLTQLKWKTFTGDRFDLCQGVTLHHAPGHTPGLCIMQVNLEKDGTFIWTTDQYHVAENHHMSQPQGWLQRDQPAWIRSHHMVLQLERLFRARLIFGHDKETVDRLMREKKFYE